MNKQKFKSTLKFPRFLIPGLKRKRMVLESYFLTSYENADNDSEGLGRWQLVRKPMKEGATLLQC